MISFQTRARTIDHLGRGQIADCPTAVSELWKNAYDAYAQNVDLHIIDGDPKIAAITDDGFGMTKQEFLERWLVIGTETKLVGGDVDLKDRFGLPERPRQGEKGIGRLSAAFLAPITLVISKKSGSKIVAALVDWRLFENPFLALGDISIPVEEFKDPKDVFEKLPQMVSVLLENFDGSGGASDRKGRVTESWDRYDKLEAEKGPEGLTSTRIRQSYRGKIISPRHFEEWPVFHGLSDHGTILLMIEIHRELAVWTEHGLSNEDDEIAGIKSKLRRTLTAFVDPFSDDPPILRYEVLVHEGDKLRRVLSSSDVFGIDDLRQLEHCIEGNFDKMGIFTGKLCVFGKDRGSFTVTPSRPAPPISGRDELGPFSLCLGTFEQERENTTHNDATHALLMDKASEFSGIAVYRDGLRVMPYGRPDSDFFNVEERRGRHAGREFWAHRRSFGRVAFTHANNPNLKDKAGREGLVDNKARRELQLLVMHLLRDVALRFFGTDSDIRTRELPDIQNYNKTQREAAAKSRKFRKKNLRGYLAERTPLVTKKVEEARSLKTALDEPDKSFTPGRLAEFNASLELLLDEKDEIRLPSVSGNLGDNETSYRKYRDLFAEYGALLDKCTIRISELAEIIGIEVPADTARKKLQSNQSRLSSQLTNSLKKIELYLGDIADHWKAEIDNDRSIYYQRTSPLLPDLDKGGRLSSLLNNLDAVYQELSDAFDHKYQPLIRTLEQVKENSELEGALSVTEADKELLEEQLANFVALSQVGISVEIIGHELESLDAQIGRNLKRLPADARETEAYKLAFEAYRALVDRLRFLTPLKVAGYRAREKITGQQIASYLEGFFGDEFKRLRISAEFTNSFRGIEIIDLPSRIYPVFLNLVNNSLYWLGFAKQRKLKIDRIDSLVIVSDTGPGVDPDDVPRLFELFYTRRASGRGVGLYLSRLNLGVAHHQIRYATPDDPHPLSGANFIIEFRGL